MSFLGQMTLYGLVGGTAALVEWSVFGLCQHTAGMHYLLATTIAFLVATLVNFVMGRKTAFRSARIRISLEREWLGVFLVSLAGLFLNLGWMGLFAGRFAWQPLTAKITATGIVFFWNFLVRRYVLYRA